MTLNTNNNILYLINETGKRESIKTNRYHCTDENVITLEGFVCINVVSYYFIGRPCVVLFKQFEVPFLDLHIY